MKQDFEDCNKDLTRNGIIVLDDPLLYTSYKPFAYSTAGHPDPSQLADEIGNDFLAVLSIGHN